MSITFPQASKLGGVELLTTTHTAVKTDPVEERVPATGMATVPELGQCPGQPLALDVLFEALVSRIDMDARALAALDSFDLSFEIVPCP